VGCVEQLAATVVEARGQTQLESLVSAQF